ncbi:MAG: DUF1684 domain-containing protein [Halobacteriaceae archaeon]
MAAEPAVEDPERWRADLAEYRESKDRYLGAHPNSPLPPDQRAAFEGLSYFPPNPALRFVVALAAHDDGETVTVETTAEGERTYDRVGAFTFLVDGEAHSLEAYRERGSDRAGLWVPFRDETSGEETYGAGRYLDLDPDEHRTGDGEWVLDFNYAYSPFCAYSDAYECPLVPMENWLDVRVQAGEKDYAGPGGDRA